MNLEALNWDVVVAGYWNPAILTPSGIARRLFSMEEGTPITVEVPLDWPLPFRVKNDNLTITAEMGRLVIVADAPRFELLERARVIAAKAINELPETPLSAAGYNVRMKVNEPSDALLAATACGADDLLSDADFSIESRDLKRSLKVGDGVVNVEIHQGKDVTVLFNFHRQSPKRDELTAWLSRPIGEVEGVVSTLMEKIVGVSMGEIGK